MLQTLIPRLLARDLEVTKNFYVNTLSFTINRQYEDYLIVAKDNVEIHFHHNEHIKPDTSDKMFYLRVSKNIKALYDEYLQKVIQAAQLGKL